MSLKHWSYITAAKTISLKTETAVHYMPLLDSAQWSDGRKQGERDGD